MAGCSCRYLDHTNKLIVLALANRANDDAIAWPSMPTLMRDCVFSSESAMRDRLRGLERIGLIETTPGTGRTSSRYRLNLGAIETHIDGSSVGDGSEPCPAKRKDEDAVITAPRTTSSRRPETHRGQRHDGAQDNAITAPRTAQSRRPGQRHHGPNPIREPIIEPLSNPREPAPTQPAAERKERDPKPAQTQGRGQEPDKARERTDDEVNAAWSALAQEAGPRLAARAMTRLQWLDWAQAWQESGGSIEDCRTVGRYIARGGLDWLKKSKTSWIASNWPDVLAQALESPQKRAERATSEPEPLTHARMRKGAVPPPPEALEALSKLGFAMGGGAK